MRKRGCQSLHGKKDRLFCSRSDKQITPEHKIKQANKKCSKVFLGFWNNRSENKSGKRYPRRMINIQASRPRLVDRNDSASTTITFHIDRYRHASSVLSSWRNGEMQ